MDPSLYIGHAVLSKNVTFEMWNVEANNFEPWAERVVPKHARLALFGPSRSGERGENGTGAGFVCLCQSRRRTLAIVGKVNENCLARHFFHEHKKNLQKKRALGKNLIFEEGGTELGDGPRRPSRHSLGEVGRVVASGCGGHNGGDVEVAIVDT